MKRFLILLILSFLVQSCARIGSPIGGTKDTLAPKFLSSNIDTARINVDRNIKELRIDFDEYITLKDIQKNLIISPPIKNITRILPSTIANKFLLIQWKDTLQANTTYNFNFGNSIVDNNENNALRYYNFAFSTGDKIDDLYISGEVKDPLSVKNQSDGNKLVVGLYQAKDTISYNQKPYYITKVDDDGYFELNYLSPGKYKIIAFDDQNDNSVFDAGKEKVGFQKEIVNVEKSISGLNLKVYNSKKAVKYKEMRENPGGVLMLFEGNPDDVIVNSVSEKLKDIKVTHRPKSDSVFIWFDAVKNELGQKVAEKLLFSYDIKSKQDTVSLFYKFNAKSAMEINNNNGGNLLPPKTDFRILSNFELDKLNSEKWTLKSDSVTTHQFTASISKTNPYEILVKSDFISGKSYQLTVPKETVSSFYLKNPQSKRFDFEVDKVENYGTLSFELTNEPKSSYWLQLLDTSDKVIYQQYTTGKKVDFNMLSPGEYIVKILVDSNGNHYWDEADFENEIFAEDSYLYYKKVVVRPLWESKEEWDLNDTRTFDPMKEGVKKAVVKPQDEFKNSTLETEKPIR